MGCGCNHWRDVSLSMLGPPKATGGQDDHKGHGHRRWKSPGSPRVGISFLVRLFHLVEKQAALASRLRSQSVFVSNGYSPAGLLTFISWTCFMT
ncbi:unnamed protein product [uncultured bacterium]|nr:unnamed protein product [uncultured bacterium]